MLSGIVRSWMAGWRTTETLGSDLAVSALSGPMLLRKSVWPLCSSSSWVVVFAFWMMATEVGTPALKSRQ